MSRAKKIASTEAPPTPAQPFAIDAPEPARVSKLATIITLLQVPDGATIDALGTATGWQSHSVRGAIAGSLKRKGYAITSAKPEDGPRRYRIEAAT